MIRTVGQKFFEFPDYKLAHDHLDHYQKGIEIGAAAHNPFNLDNCINVGLNELLDVNDYEFFKQAQIETCGAFAIIDVGGEADVLPFEDYSLDYIITSHVIEHLPNPIKTFNEWDRVIKPGGKIFSIIPLRNALEADIGRDLTTLKQFIQAYLEDWTPDTVPHRYEATVPGGKRGHYYVYNLETFNQLITWCNSNLPLFNWTLVDSENPDKKVGNGFTTVYQK